MRFEQSVPLKSGRNVVSVDSRDLLGQKTTTRLVWMADWNPPELVITRVVEENGRWLIEGSCSDDNALKSLFRFLSLFGIPPTLVAQKLIQLLDEMVSYRLIWCAETLPDF